MMQIDLHRRRLVNLADSPIVIPENDLVLYMPFNGSVTDSTGNHTPISNGVEYGAGVYTGSIPGSVYWDFDYSKYVRVPDSDFLSFSNNITDEPFSITTAINFPITNGIFMGSKRGGSGNEYLFHKTEPDQKIRLVLFDSVSGGNISAYTDNPVVRNKPYHLGATYDGNGGIKIYINGVEQSIVNESSGTYECMKAGTANFEVMSSQGTVAASGGTIVDGLGVWRVCLSPEEMLLVATKQMSGNEII